MLSTSVKLLRDMGKSLDEIAHSLGIDVESVKQLSQ